MHRRLTERAQAAADVERQAHERATAAYVEAHARAAQLEHYERDLAELERELATAGPSRPRTMTVTALFVPLFVTARADAGVIVLELMLAKPPA